MSGGKFQDLGACGGRADAGVRRRRRRAERTVEVAHTAPYYFFGKDPTFALGCAIPFGLNSRQITAWMYEGNGLKLMREFYAKYNMINFPGGNTGAQMGGWFRKEVKTLADVKGLKFRIGGFGGKVIERIGGVPQNIRAGDLPGAREGHHRRRRMGRPVRRPEARLQQGRAELLLPRLVGRRPQLDFLHQHEGLGGTVAEYKAMVERPHRTPSRDAGQVRRAQPDALKTLVGQGTKLFRFPKDVMESSFKAAGELYAELSSSNPAWKKIFDDFSAFRRDANLWFRFTEAGFDDFMQGQKL
jgi:TRAP-type mannitol/chloroaromatic compound transport system substrate-binding protein